MSWEHPVALGLDRLDPPPAPLIRPALFPPEYRTLTPPELALRDAQRLNQLLRENRDGFDLWEDRSDSDYRLRLYSRQEHALDTLMPWLQNLGLRVTDQIAFRLEAAAEPLCLRAFAVRPALPCGEDFARRKPILLDALDALLAGTAENDGLNGLLLSTGLGWREIDVFRAYRNYYFQLGGHFGRFRFHQALLSNPRVAGLLFRYFAARFAPDGRWHDANLREEEALSPLRQALALALDNVTDSAEDRILRDIFNLIDATLRTDFYRHRKTPTDTAIAFKIGSLGVINLPAPRPLFEIYVHARHMEGIHLRGAKVARGGIRWSDRPDDFRSEILGLMRTQMVKNTLIVPLGAKGGFILKGGATSEDAAHQAYTTLIQGLLNLTDNRVGTTITSPPGLMVYDDADPYLVVAADKGTSRLSDRANSLAADYGFWLGDAFASGGSRGYHHKRLGITARGAWVCVQRHFREAGQDIDQRPFTVVGIGSLDGDVFGNGMLLSEHIRLLGAFGASHIFLDPTPDPGVSFQERRRLFDLPHSGWQNYDPARISPGGGVFRRDAKDIPLSSAVRAWLGVRHASVDGEELVRLLLTAPVDLLWLGGIGTYVKASTETHDHAADRDNDRVRVDANQLRAKVVGEGANLGFTQQARIEYALAGGRINTDAVDNSGGVDLSDHEVNLKILMAQLQHRGVMADVAERDQWLSAVTEDTVRAVLADNLGQSLCLSLDLVRGQRDIEPFLEVAERLANAGILDRAVESFPSRKDIVARGGAGLTRPELAVLMAHAKLALKRGLLANPEFTAEPWARELFASYFPALLRERFGAYLSEHSLAADITATVVCNTVIAQAGVEFLAWVDEWEPADLVRAVRVYHLFDRMIDGPALRASLGVFDHALDSGRYYAEYLRLEDILAGFCRWALQSDPLPATDWRAALRTYLDYLTPQLPEHQPYATELMTAGLTADHARLLAYAERLGGLPELVALAARTGEALTTVARLADAIVDELGVRHLLDALAGLQPRDLWERRAREALLDRFRTTATGLCLALLRGETREPATFFAQPTLQPALNRFRHLHRELTENTAASLSPFVALGAALENLREAAVPHPA